MIFGITGISKKSTCDASVRNGLDPRPTFSAVLALAIGGLAPTVGNAYTAAGDRNFPATVNLPQLAPTDAFWTTISTQPMTATATGDPTRETVLTGTYSKMITERLGIQIKDGPILSNRLGASSVWGAQNFSLVLNYEAIIDQPHEFVLSVQVGEEFGGTGSRRVGSQPQSATTPAVIFGKGLGDLPIGYWRPLAVTGFAGYQAAEGARTSTVQAGFSIQYSIPYLVSKVANVDLPPFLRGMTPLTEVLYTTPVRGQSQGTTLLIAPGISYSEGKGWELAVEAMIPTTKATGRGFGVIAQFVLQLDYLLPNSVFGRPIFSPH